MAVKKAPKKALLCFHGTGSKGSIFHVQMARICYQLDDMFEFIFIDGPRECAPGPGVLPMFSGQEPYYDWFGGHDVSIDDSIREINGAVQRGLDEWRKRKNNADAAVDIVGGVGFSEGGLALTLMLWLQQEQQQQQTLPPLQFAAISCCFFPREASLWINARAQAQGKTTALIDVPTLHIHGNRDFCLGRARQLVRNHYRPQCAIIVQVDTSHHLPTQKDDVAEVVKHIRNLAGVEASTPHSGEGQ
jgi:predicted esterase